jgi:hypothetical protein
MMPTSLNAQIFRHTLTVPGMAYDAAQRRRGIEAFLKRTGLSAREVCIAGGLSPSALSQFLNGITQGMGDKSYQALAAGASKKLFRPVTVAEFRGELAPKGQPKAKSQDGEIAQVAVRHYVGAGDRVYLVKDQDAVEYVEAPPGYERGSAVIVRGESGKPLFEDGDVLFFKELLPPPKKPTTRAVIVQVGEDLLYLKKLVPGTKRGHYHLLSMNPTTPMLYDQHVIAIARVGVAMLKDMD